MRVLTVTSESGSVLHTEPEARAMATRKPRLPSPRTQTALWVAAAAPVIVALMARWPLTGDVSMATAAVLGASAVAASALEFKARARVFGRDVQQVITLTEAALVLLLFTVPPGWAWLLTLMGYAIANAVPHQKLLRLTFNVAVWSVSLAAGIGVHELLAPDRAGLTLPGVAAVAAAVVVHLALNAFAVTVVVAASTGSDVRRELASTAVLDVYAAVGALSLGVAATAVWQLQPWLLPSIAVIGLLLRHGHEQHVAFEGASEQVRVERDRLDEVVAATEQGLVLIDHAGDVTLWNTAIARMTGIDADEALGRNADVVMAGALVGDDGTPLLLAGSAGEAAAPTTVRGWLHERDGDRRRVDVRHAVQRDDLGHGVSDVVQIRDRTAQYELDRLQDDFLSRISHELRTPLTTIIGFARTLRDHRSRLTDEQLDRMENGVIARSEELTALIDDLMLVARSDLETRKEAGAASLAWAAQTAADKTRHRWPEHTIEVHVDDQPVVNADATSLVTILRHLLSNACKFSPAGSTVDLRVTADPSGDAVVRVTDTGRGIPQSRHEQIFGRFTRTEDPLLMETRGAGIGLHAVHRLVASLGGNVTVDSTPGKGSIFTVRLPPAGQTQASVES